MKTMVVERLPLGVRVACDAGSTGASELSFRKRISSDVILPVSPVVYDGSEVMFYEGVVRACLNDCRLYTLRSRRECKASCQS
jgi:hypothetical protein